MRPSVPAAPVSSRVEKGAAAGFMRAGGGAQGSARGGVMERVA